MIRSCEIPVAVPCAFTDNSFAETLICRHVNLLTRLSKNMSTYQPQTPSQSAPIPPTPNPKLKRTGTPTPCTKLRDYGL